MVDVKEYLKTAGGSWLSADAVVVNDKLLILDAGVVDEETFDRPYLNVQMRLLRTNEDFGVRLGPKNAGRIAETLGNDTAKWVGQLAEVISIETYKGIGKKGFLLRGAKKKAEVKEALVPTSDKPTMPTVHFLRQSQTMIEKDYTLSEMDWSSFVEKHIQEDLLKSGLVERQDDGYHFTDKAKEYL